MDVQQFEQAILKLAFETNTRLTSASVAYYMGMPTREASRLLNALLEEGVLELDSDVEGNLFYRVPHQSEISAGLRAPEPAAPQAQRGPIAKTDVQIVEEALAREDARLVSLDEDDAISDVFPPAAAFSPRRHRPNGEAEGYIAARDQRPMMMARGAAPSQAPVHVQQEDPVAHAIMGRGAGRRGVVLDGAVSSAADGTPGMGYGRRGVSSPLVQAGARCEHKPLPEARAVLASCATAQDEPPAQRAMPASTALVTQDWWSRDQGAGLQQGGAMVLAGAGHMPVTMDHIEQPEHQPGMALLLSLILCGTGQIYNGEVSKGITMMVLCFLLWFVLLGWVVHIWSIVDAVVVAERISRRQQAAG